MKNLEPQEMEHLLQTVEDGVLALTDGKTPYSIPFGFIYIEGAVFISFFPTGRKWVCFQKNNQVCFTVFAWNDDRTQWSSVVIDGIMEQVSDLETIKTVVIANTKKMGLDPEKYIDKRMEYYQNSLDNPKALKIFKINVQTMGGKTMKTMLGNS